MEDVLLLLSSIQLQSVILEVSVISGTDAVNRSQPLWDQAIVLTADQFHLS